MLTLLIGLITLVDMLSFGKITAIKGFVPH